jgi:CRP-like cAMP-binding protein
MGSSNKLDARARRLRDQALEEIAGQKHDKAVVTLEKLIDLEPDEPEWPRRAADSYWYLKNKEKRLHFSALAAQVYASNGVMLKAIAMCKVALSIDPNHRATLKQLAQLNAGGTRPQRPVFSAEQPPPGRGDPLAKIRLHTRAILEQKKLAAGNAEGQEATAEVEAPPIEATQALHEAKARQRTKRAQARMAAAAKLRAARVRQARTKSAAPEDSATDASDAVPAQGEANPSSSPDVTPKVSQKVEPSAPIVNQARTDSLGRRPIIPREDPASMVPARKTPAPREVIVLQDAKNGASGSERRAPLELERTGTFRGLPAIAKRESSSTEQEHRTQRFVTREVDSSREPSAPHFQGVGGAFPSIPAPALRRASGAPLERLSLNARLPAEARGSLFPNRGGIYSLTLDEIPVDQITAEHLPKLAPPRDPSVRIQVPFVVEPPYRPEDAIPSLSPPRKKSSSSEALAPDSLLELEPASLIGGSELPESSESNRPGFQHGTTTLVPPESFSDLFSDDDRLREQFDQSPARGGFALENTPLLSELHPDVLNELVGELELVELFEGEVLFSQGDTADAMYVVVEGALVASIKPEGSEPIELARLEEGEFFGEIGLLSDQPRQASVIARENSRLLRFDRAAISQLMARDPHFLSVLLSFLRERLVEGLMTTSPLFAPFNEAERLDLANRFEFLEVEADSVLLDPGQRPVGMYVLLTGEALCTGGAGSANLQTLGPGAIFGESALLNNARSDLEVVTLTKSFALCLPSDSFFEVIMTHPTVLEYISGLTDGSHGHDSHFDQIAFY